jgi:hypothetical protein
MSTPRTCKHCNGTTYCGGSISATSGKLRTRPACPTCLVKSRLDPAGIFDRVVCSVCKGTGETQPESEIPQRRQTSAWGYSAVVGIVLAAFGFFGLSLYFYVRELNTGKDQFKTLQEQAHKSHRESSESIKKVVTLGVTGDYVRFTLGEPNSTRELGNDESVLEIWDYYCLDGGLVEISMLNGKVQSIKP